MDLVFVVSVFYHASDNDRYSAGGSDDFVSYEFSTGPVKEDLAVKNALLVRQKVGDGPLVPVMVPAVDANWIPGVFRNTIAKVERDYGWYGGGGLLSENDELD